MEKFQFEILPQEALKRERRKRDLNERPLTEAEKAARFQPGQSGNPNGRPKGQGKGALSKYYKEAIERLIPIALAQKLGILPQDMSGVTDEDIIELLPTWGEVIAAKQVEQAAMGLLNSVQELREATEGKSVERLGDPDGNPLQTSSLPPVHKFVFVTKEEASCTQESHSQSESSLEEDLSSPSTQE